MVFSKILTCGSDGDIRMWTKPEDESPVVFSASDGCLAICCHKNTAYVGTENNTVESFSLPSGKLEKVITKFTAAVNHVDVSKSGDILAAASGLEILALFDCIINWYFICRDMTFQIIKLRGDSPPTKIEGHRAPVLSVCISNDDEFVISTGCDGCVCIWDLTGKQVKSWDGVFQPSNDISTSKTLCRPSWSSNGKILAVPQQNTIDLFSVGDWKELKTLKTVGSNTKVRLF
jgi:WD40 repeat protein